MISQERNRSLTKVSVDQMLNIDYADPAVKDKVWFVEKGHVSTVLTYKTKVNVMMGVKVEASHCQSKDKKTKMYHQVQHTVFDISNET